MAALGTRLLKIKIDSVEYTAQVSKAVITSGEADADFVTFADAAAGGAREYRLEFTAVQDMATTTLWEKVWSNSGTTVACTLNPYGVGTFAPATPGFTFSAVIAEPDGDFIGGEANSSNSARMTFDCSWVLTAKPTRVTTGSF
ncbi:hypothetical protein [Nocardioides antri]|uniref:Phage tail protein n=1 Tax=Nocardioides antri TaxID=2607659 RepID=A0A5B1LUH1_9ACTN|nr:hypothetical protein [Nocardioides antri]KAA1424313.1 hypothetical protein F0U47_18950 [Nocardioides antri]